uniref:Uncharacterized protein n=1 Tax=Mycena chlorophos TaxID=658473 RepID=A0ABQ0L467_MYCCL|nr:predicted protein [Mycena chlorophos]
MLSAQPEATLASYSISAYDSGSCSPASSIFETLSGSTNSTCVIFPGGESLVLSMSGNCNKMTAYASSDCTAGTGDQSDSGNPWTEGWDYWRIAVEGARKFTEPIATDYIAVFAVKLTLLFALLVNSKARTTDRISAYARIREQQRIYHSTTTSSSEVPTGSKTLGMKVRTHFLAVLSAAALSPHWHTLARGDYTITAYNLALCSDESTISETVSGHTNSTCIPFPNGRSYDLDMSGSCTRVVAFASGNCTMGPGDQTDTGSDWEVGCQSFEYAFNSFQVFC